ncbi:MAG: class I SAM-dependent methyltransferase [Anaerolineae bacterium]|nr:class I SAM-dependent methyltransferase [Anaerolineae bacterium]
MNEPSPLPVPDGDRKTLDYYDQRGQDFFDRTVGLNVPHILQPFLERVPHGGHILDAGCGSGRESKLFLDRGYRVTAFDGSATMARLASAYIGQPVQHLTFDQMNFEGEFDGIWACATLLHVPLNDLPGVFERFIRALKPGSVWFASFKWGSGERQTEEGRRFTDFDDNTFRAFAARFPALTLEQLWQNSDGRPEAQGGLWLNALLRRQP